VLNIQVGDVEITQGIQCLDATAGDRGCPDNGLALVGGKATLVRVFPRVSHDGALPGEHVYATIKRLSATGSELGVVAPRNGGIQLKDPPQRTEINDSWNFRLPVDWTLASTLYLRIELNTSGSLAESDYEDNERELVLLFEPSASLAVLYRPVRFAPPGQAPVEPTDRIRNNGALAAKLYPLAQGALRYTRGGTIHYGRPLATFADEQRFVGVLNRYYEMMLRQGGAPDQLVAWLPAHTAHDLGLSDPLWTAPPGAGRVTLNQDTVDGAFTLAHELAHNLGRRHPGTPDGCGAKDGATDWPKASYGDSARIQEVGVDLFANGGAGAVKDPATHFDMMSYCSAVAGHPPLRDIWISPFTYGRLQAGRMQPQTVESAPAVFLVSGALTKTAGGSLDPVWRMTGGGAPEAPSPGTGYCLEQQNAAGAPLGSTCFDAKFVDHYERPVDEVAFSFVLAALPDAARLVLKQRNATLAVRAASAHPPTVTITAPAAGALWDGVQTMRWQAADLDGDALLYAVSYSPDAGATWRTVAVDLQEPSLALDTRELPGGNQALVRVLASDGFHSTSADSSLFRVPRKGPSVFIFGPADGARVAPGVPLLLEGGSDDLESGPLPETALTWSSDRAGFLGTGSVAPVDGLAAGDHRITLTGRDAEGNVAWGSIMLHVAPLPFYLPVSLGNYRPPLPSPAATATRTATSPAPPAATPTRTRTATPPIARTPTRTATAAPLLQDDFGNSASGWPHSLSDAFCERRYEGGEYHILAKTDGIIAASYPRAFDNFVLEVNARKLAGPDSAAYGVLVRHEPSTNYLAISHYYYLWVNPAEGTYGVLRWQGGWMVLRGATASGAILRGTATNQLRVACSGQTIRITVNGILLATLSDANIASGWIALSASGNGMHAHFDNLRVWPPP
jgi:hypothetical protein